MKYILLLLLVIGCAPDPSDGVEPDIDADLLTNVKLCDRLLAISPTAADSLIVYQMQPPVYNSSKRCGEYLKKYSKYLNKSSPFTLYPEKNSGPPIRDTVSYHLEEQ